MKYTDNRTINGGITFDDVPQGELFMYGENLYMKTSIIEANDTDKDSNAVAIWSGNLLWIDYDTEVERVKASLTITNW